MKHFFDYSEYVVCFLFALTHKYIALAIIVVADLRNLERINLEIQTVVLILTAIGVIAKIIIDVRGAIKNNTNHKKQKK